MAHPATERIVRLFSERGIQFRMVEHVPCRTSEESAQARTAAGDAVVCGAKAIVVKLKRKGGATEFGVLVLPGSSRIDAKMLLEHLPDVKDFRFATQAELADHAEGLAPGMMPPFARTIFERLTRLYVDPGLLDHRAVGFNAADLTRSIIVASKDYVRVAAPDAMFRFSAHAKDR